MDKINLPHRGFGSGTVPVDRAPGDLATVVEIQGNLLGGYDVYGVIDTPERLEQGDKLFSVFFTRRRVRALVPQKYTHLKIKRRREHGIVWWKVGFRPADTCPELRDTVAGKHPDVVQYRGPAAKATLEVGKGDGATLEQFRLTGKRRREPEYVRDGSFRGVVELSKGPILFQVNCSGSWSLTIRK